MISRTWPAGIVKLTLRPPLAKRTAGSCGRPGSGVNSSVAVPFSSTGKPCPSWRPKEGWLAGGTVSWISVTVSGGSGGRAMFTVKLRLAERGGWWPSETVAVNVNVPGVVGVPVMAPVAGFNERPGGRDPEVMLHCRGARPVAWMVALYGSPTLPLGRLAVTIAGRGNTVKA